VNPAACCYLVDASVYIFRAWFSLPPELSDPAGRPTNALYGFAGFLCALLEETSAERIALAFDSASRGNFRNALYPAYKANRAPTPDELKVQFPWCRELAEALGLACHSHPRYEADDLIGTLAKTARGSGARVVVVSSDKDLCQVLAAGDHWWDHARQVRLDPARVQDKFGVPPAWIADFLALTGDSVDNIPGIPGIGRKTAARLLHLFDGWDGLWQNLDRVPKAKLRGAAAIAERLAAGRPQAELARRLTHLETAVDGLDHAQAIRRGAADRARLTLLIERFGFGPTLSRRLLGLA